MSKGVRLNQEELVARYGISERLAVRVRVLLTRGIEVSAALLESARPGTEIETLLFSPELLRDAEHLTDKGFEGLVDSSSVGEIKPALLVKDDGTRIIVLREELTLAERHEKLPSLLSPINTALRLINEDETRKLFNAEELARLKITILTSTNSSIKTEAIRRLAISPLESTTKGMLLVHALTDNDHAVRVEAAEALTALGLHQGIASAARSLCDGNENQRIKATDRLAVLIRSVSEAETGVILTILAGALKKEPSAAVAEVLIKSFKGACTFVADNRQYVSELVHLLVMHLEGYERLHYRSIRDVLGEIGRASPDMMTELLVGELDSVSSKLLKRLLFGIMAMFEVPEEARPILARQACDAMKGSANPEEECQGIGSMLSGWGDTAVEALTERIFDVDDACKIYVIHLIDEIVCQRGGQARADDAANVLLDLLRVCDRHIALSILESRLIGQEILSEQTKFMIAEELLENLNRFANPRVDSVIENALFRIGIYAIPHIKSFISEEEDELRRRTACRTIIAIVKAAQDERVANDALDFFLALWADGQRIGYFAEAIGKIAGASRCPEEKLKPLLDEMIEELGSSADPVGILQGLSGLSGSAALGTESKTKIAQVYFDLLKSQLPEVEDRIACGETEEEVHHFGNELAAYTDIVPACLEGLEQVFADTNSGPLRSKISEFLTEFLIKARELEIIISPGSQNQLMQILTRMARESDDDRAASLANTLFAFVESPHVVDALCGILAAREGSLSLGDLACRIGKQILEKLKSGKSDAGVLHEMLATIACRMNLGRNPTEAYRMRERAINALYQGLKDGYKQALAGLRSMHECGAISKTLRTEIGIRLGLAERHQKV